jgi:hypothetical protein
MVLYRWLVAIILCAITDASHVFSQSSTDGPGQSAYKAALYNAAAIRNFDVTVSEWYNTFSADKSLQKEVEDSGFRVKYRLIVDIDKEQCFFLKHVESEAAQEGKRSISTRDPSWYFEYYESGQRKSRRLVNAMTEDRPKRVEFWSFFRDAKVPMPQMYGIWSYPGMHVTPFPDLIEKTIENYSESRMKVLADGSFRIYKESEWKDRVQKVTLFFDPGAIVPVKYMIASERDGRTDPIYEHTVEYETIEGISRPVKLVFSRLKAVSLEGPFSPKVPGDQVGEVDLKWNSMNSKALEFVDIELLGQDLTAWSQALHWSSESAKAPSK